MPRYHRRYTGTKGLLLFVPIAAIIAGSSLFAAREPAPAIALLVVLVFVAFVVAIFSTLTVEVTDRELVFGFALGVMRRRIPMTDIVRAQRIILPW
jgi:hypothetical protein